MGRVADNVADIWYNTLNSSPDQASKICLRSVEFPDNAYTYAEVDALSNQVAHWALSKGLKPRDVVALFMENRPAYIIHMVGSGKGRSHECVDQFEQQDETFDSQYYDL